MFVSYFDIEKANKKQFICTFPNVD